jgi:methanogenic corrinoid protein MtbC1
MSQALSSAPTSRPDVDPAAATAPLATVVYRSMAVRPLSAVELRQLIGAAQARNRAEAVTGLMLYDEAAIYQWLEGPVQGLHRIMRSIRNDPRHAGIEVLDRGFAPARIFTGWDMKLVTRSAGFATSRNEVIYPPARIIDGLRQHPNDAAALLAELAASATVPGRTAPSRSARRAAAKRAALPALTAVIHTAVIPKLLENHGLAPFRPDVSADALARDLAGLLIAADQTAAFELIDDLQAAGDSTPRLFATLFEPAARILGDLWRDDACSEFDVTIALCRMQTAVRLRSVNRRPRHARSSSAPAVLVAPEPGEPHGLCATLDTEVLWDAGWFPQCAFPADDGALQDALAERWFDVLDLSLSTTFRREHWLPRVSQTIARARHASINPAIVVIVGGRVFTEVTTAGAQVGADAASKTSLNLDRLIMAKFERGA